MSQDLVTRPLAHTTHVAVLSEYLFKHTLLKDVTYETFLLEERRDWHVSVTQWLIATSGERKSEHGGTIAAHFEWASETGNPHDSLESAGRMIRLV